MRALLLTLALVLATAAHAVEPDEVLPDPVLEARAREISQGLRCLVCQNENIDDSHAALAKDLRIVLRERLVAGDTDEQAVAFIVARYGEFVLLRPTSRGVNLLLWIAGPLMAAFGLVIAFVTLRARRRAAVEPLSAEEAARVEELRRG